MSLSELKPLKPLTDSTKVRAMLSEIEAALARGVTREQVLEKLKADGTVSEGFGLRGLDAAVRRERKLRAKHPERATVVGQPATVAVTPKVDQPTRAVSVKAVPEQVEPETETKQAQKSNIGRVDLRKLRQQNSEQNTLTDSETDPRFR